MAKKKEQKQEVITLVNEQEVTEQLKKTIASLRLKIEKLEKENANLKQLDKEGDELNEKRISEIEHLKTEVQILNERCHMSEIQFNVKCERVLAQEVAIGNLREKIKEQEETIAQLKNANDELLDYKLLPWYKKIFT